MVKDDINRLGNQGQWIGRIYTYAYKRISSDEF